MNYSNVLLIMSDGEVRAIRVSYEENGKRPSIMKTFDQTIKPGDYVVVQTSTRHNMTVCRVDACDVEVDAESEDEIKWIIAKVDLDLFDSILAREKTIIDKIKENERRQKREALRKQIVEAGGADVKLLSIADLTGGKKE